MTNYIELNCGGSGYMAGTGFIGGTSVIIDGTKIDIDWMNSILSVQKPVSQTTTKTSYNNNNDYTYAALPGVSGIGVITNTTTTFSTELKSGDVIVLNGVEYPMQIAPSANLCYILNNPIPAASGKLVCYKMPKDYGINLKRIQHNITVEGWLTNDYVHHPSLATKYYAEKKVDLLYEICGANGGNPDFANIVLRENSYLTNKYVRFVPLTDSGTGTGALNSFTDGTKTWTTNIWASSILTDKNKAKFTIASNTGTVLTVSGTPATGSYSITSAITGRMACTRMKISDTTGSSAPIRIEAPPIQRVDKIFVSLSFRYTEPK